MSLTPNLPDVQESYHYAEAGTPRWVALLFVILFLAAGALGYVSYSTNARLEQALSRSADQNRLVAAQLEQANSRLADLKGHLEVTEQKLGMTRAEVAQANSRAETIRKEQKAADERLTSQLGQVKQQSQEQIGAVATEVGTTKKDLADTRSDLEATKGKLEHAMGDMGVMSGLIAHNRDDLEDLRRRGDRNYFEFTLGRGRTAQKVGPIQLKLEHADQKKQRYTVTVFADDKAIEKRDKTAGEPVQFFVQGSGRMAPFEIVVFTVGKDNIKGYLSTPKEGAAAPAAAAKPTS